MGCKRIQRYPDTGGWTAVQKEQIGEFSMKRQLLQRLPSNVPSRYTGIFKQVKVFKYLGRLLAQDDDNIQAVR